MASGLGVTVDPAGEVGSGNTSAAAAAETIADNPGTITQSTAIQTLDQLLYDNWIFDDTFTVSTNMPAGTVVWVKPIHPAIWNWPNQRVSTMFNLWTGAGKIRYRPLATAWYGGSIRVGLLPPNLTMQQVRSLPLRVLTSYPNRDIDPKNTAWVDLRAVDQREIAYHYMKPVDTEDRQSFGGYVVFYVAGKLVTQAPEFSTIQFMVETCGDFMYDQPSPRALEDPTNLEFPLGSAAAMPFETQAMVGNLDIVQAIQICASSITSIPAPGAVSGVGHPKTQDLPGFNIPSELLPFWETNVELPETNVIQLFNNVTGYTPADDSQVTDNLEMTGRILAFMPTADAPGQGITGGSGVVQPAEGKVAFTALTLNANKPFPVAFRRGIYGEPTSGPISFAKVNNTFQTTLAPMASGESIVLFTNEYFRSYATQTLLYREFLKRWPKDEAKMAINSWLFNVRNEVGTPLFMVRLNPNGLFTTNPASADAVIPAKGLYLEFVEELPISSPLPSVTPFTRSVLYDIRKMTRKNVPIKEVAEYLSVAI